MKNLPVEITNILDTEELWSFDIISLERLTDHRPLVTLGLKIMTRFNVCDHLKIDQGVLVNWLTLMESNYRRSNPYHNSTHASDVLHATAYFLSTEQLMVSHYFYILNISFQFSKNSIYFLLFYRKYSKTTTGLPR